MSKIMSINQAADYLGISTRTTYEMVKDGRIPAIKIGRQWRINADDLEHLFAPKNIELGDS